MRDLTEKEKEASRRLHAIWKQRKKETGLTQAKLAEQVGVKHEFLVHLMHGRRRLYPDVVRKLADALGVSPTDIQDDFEDRVSNNFGLIESTRYQKASKLIKHKLEKEGLKLTGDAENKLTIYVYNQLMKGREVTCEDLNNIVKYESSLDPAC